MGFFAVLGKGGLGDPVVQKLDINFWVLPRIFARTGFLCDVGLRLLPTQGDLTEVSLAIPFGTRDGDLRDLIPRMLNSPDDFQLIFRKPLDPAPKTGPRRYDDGDGEMSLISVDLKKCERDQNNSTASLSVWRIVLSSAMPQGSSGYLRLRFEVRSTGRAWMWVSTVKGRARAVVDLRVSDLRETLGAPIDIDWHARVLDIAKINVFVIAPAIWEARRISPDPTYTRLLEGVIWEHHLDRAINLVRKSKLIVYRWHQTAAVTKDEPFLGFMALRRYTRINLPVLLNAVAVSTLTVGLLVGSDQLRSSLAFSAIAHLAALSIDHWRQSTVVLVGLAVLRSLKNFYKMIPGLRAGLERARAAERSLYRKMQHQRK